MSEAEEAAVTKLIDTLKAGIQLEIEDPLFPVIQIKQGYDDGIYRTAVISSDEQYRWSLFRQWDSNLPVLVWVMLNPSTADGRDDDPTIRRCIAFAKSWGYGGILVVNLYALRSTDPKLLWQHPDPVGPKNDEEIAAVATGHPLVMLAWGANAPRERARHAARLLWASATAAGHRLAVLGWTKGGHPRHPLYVRGDTRPEYCDEGELFDA